MRRKTHLLPPSTYLCLCLLMAGRSSVATAERTIPPPAPMLGKKGRFAGK